jgi:hypothetical protein
MRLVRGGVFVEVEVEVIETVEISREKGLENLETERITKKITAELCDFYVINDCNSCCQLCSHEKNQRRYGKNDSKRCPSLNYE